MGKKRLLLAAICLLLFLSAALAFTLRSRYQPAPRAAVTLDIPRAPAELIAGYRHWTRVNPEPRLVLAQNAQLCAALTTTAAPGSPHGPNKYITVYVNDVGRHAMMEEKTPQFPQGSVIVKEKLTTAKSATPELLTVMVKREAGYNPDSGDWEYMVFDGSGKSVQARGKLENCQACHKMDQDTDYVSRSYLPPELAGRLK
ncbi:MAG TPA: cytochrome P460 family protein [Pyrinomonadaceae bacterium]|nr:cytochrome P460 family protein [Pyrinomonadaceae bacterium]